MQSGDRFLAPLLRRFNNVLARGVLRATSDENGIQTMQLGLLEDETADQVERFQTYGLSSVPPNGGDALIAFLQGNRDHGVVLAVNDRASRPKGLKGGEVCLYNNAEVSLLVNADGDLIVRAKRNINVECDENITVQARRVTIEADENITLRAPVIEMNPP